MYGKKKEGQKRNAPSSNSPEMFGGRRGEKVR